ncbi:hypothetical protein BTS2_0334 [Bacillus sp. TS-2]|nr:hypothetical protein BTS2_0334 [Bacillus sp. TS-2]
MTQEKLIMKAFSMDVITAKMFNELHLSITKTFNKQGKPLILKGLEQFGIKDAESIAKKATAEGENHYFYDYLPAHIQDKEQHAELTPFARFSKLFAEITKQVVDTFGEEGEQVVMKAVANFGENRGRGIAQRAFANGLENSAENYLSNYDMGRSDLFEYETIQKENEIEQTFTKCPLGQQWADDNMGKYGILYCRMIDPSIAKGYNPKFEVEHDQYVLKEGQCHFQFKMKE